MATQIKLRRDTAQNWTNANPILALGEPGIETDTNKFKFGDGVTNWANLAYYGSEYATTDYVDTTVNNFIGNAPAALNTLQELSSAINADPNFFSTISSSLANKADTSYVDSAIANINIPSTSGLASESYVNSAINNIQLPNLDPYATTEYVDGRISNISIPNTDWANISGKPTFSTVATSGSYNDLSDKPSIPSLTGYATESYVDGKTVWANISGKPNFGNIVESNLDGNISNVLYGNGVFAALPAGVDLSSYATQTYVTNAIANVSGGGGSSNTITNTDGMNTYSVSVSTSGVVSMSTARGGLEFGAQPEEGAPQHLHIMRPAGQESSTDLYFGDDYNYVKLPGNYGEGTLGTEIGTNDLNGGNQKVWRFGTDGKITFPDGTTQSTAYVTPEQLGYFTQLTQSDNEQLDMEAVVMDSGGNSYVSYSYYDNNQNKRFGGIAKFSDTGSILWSKNLESQTSGAEYPKIASLELSEVGGTPYLVALGHYYNDTTNKDIGFMYLINPNDGSVGTMFDTELTSDNGIEIFDGVFGFDASNDPYAVMVGRTYNQLLQKTLTPIAGSTVDKLYISWSDFNASGLQAGDSLYYTDPTYGYIGLSVNVFYAVASPTGTGAGLYLRIATTESGGYQILGTNGWSGEIYGYSVPVTLTVLGSSLGGVDVTNDLTFTFDRTVFADNSNNINAAISNIQGTSISNVLLAGGNGKDWSADVGNLTTFEYQLNEQAYITRLGTNSWSKNIGSTGYDRLHTVVVDSNGNTYVGGYYWSDSLNRGGLVIKFDFLGNQQWAVYIDPSDNTGMDVFSIDLLPDGNLIALGEDGVVTKLNSSNGDIIWQTMIDGGPDWDSQFKGTATLDGDYIFTNYEDDDYTMYVRRVSGTDGSVMWTKQISRYFNGENGEIYPQDDYSAQYIDCNSTHVTIAGSTYLNFNGNSTYAGLVMNFPIDGEGIDGTYEQYIISSATLDNNIKSTTSIAATINTSPVNVTPSITGPNSSSATLVEDKTVIGEASGDLTMTGQLTGVTTNNDGYLRWVGNSSGDGNQYTTLQLVPDDTRASGDQYIVIDPTAPNHIHIRGGGEPDNCNSELIIGGETSHFKIGAGQNPPVTIRSNNYSWNFQTNGKLQFPDGYTQSTAWLGTTTIPSTSKGQTDDYPGMVAFDSNYIYYCTGYYDGITDIWKRVAWSGDTW